MLKNKETGILEKELSSITLDKNDEFILNVFAVQEQECIYVHIRLTTDKDTQDWEYNAILDYYDTEVFKDKVISISEIEESYNPSWEVVVKYTEDDEKLREITEELLEIHRKELYDVYKIIADKETEYSE
jgi:disulfide oxidoreductase YuzD